TKLLNDFLDSSQYARIKLNQLISQYSVAADEDKINIENSYNKVLETQKRYSLQLVLENLNSLACLNILYQEFPVGQLLFDKGKDIQYVKIVSDTLAKYYPNQPHVNALVDDYKTRLTTYKQNMILNSANVTELELFDIKLPSINNKTISLLSLKDEYVLLHFWSAQDKSSIEVTPNYKPVYDKYKNKGFNVYCVNVGNSVETWKSAVRFEEYDWVNVCDTAFYSTPARMVYNINQIPTNLLLDLENRQVLARNLSAVKLDSFLEDALN
ncbi:MAG: redoxin domain-containing protein, partial [Bacteroidales bacterium]|nr:redoxin domain-containing protein [Bacteroidales bacterium]